MARSRRGSSARPSTAPVWGLYGAEATLLWEITVNGKLPPKEIAKNAAMACAGAVIAPPLNRWIKDKRYA